MPRTTTNPITPPIAPRIRPNSASRAVSRGDGAFELTIPDITSFDMAKYPAFLRGELAAPPHGRGGWFVFGARKDG